jgi:6-phosphofructokinase 1
MKNKSATKTFGILTAGGDCPGLNAAIRGVCRPAVETFGMNAIGIANGYQGLLNRDMRPLGPEDLSGLLTRGGTILGASREKPFKGRYLSSDDLAQDKVRMIKECYRDYKLDCLVVLGGNGTNTTGHLLAQEGLNVIGLPKTIDNDIVGTDQTFGFASALAAGTEAIDRLHSTAQSHNRVMVIELMGHKTGWLALHAGLAGGGDVILLPEIPYDIKAISEHIVKRSDRGSPFSIVVAAEGAMSLEEARMDKRERKKYREQAVSTAYRVAREIEKKTGMDTRATVLGYVQRGGIPSASDRVLATRLGTAAAELLAEGVYGRMVRIENNQVSSVDLSVPAGKTKAVPLEHQLLSSARYVGTCLGI